MRYMHLVPGSDEPGFEGPHYVVEADPNGAKYLMGRFDSEKSRNESATDTDSTQ